MVMLKKVEDFIYKRIIKNLIYSSRLGRRSALGYADSGINFDHIYQNNPKGYNRFGVIVDRLLLNLPGCKATRERFKKIKRILEDEFRRNVQRNVKTKI